MDNLKPDQRKKNMRHIRSKDTKPEIVLRKALWEKGFRYRKNYKYLPGKPDIVLMKYRICIFVDSEFFHGKGFVSDYDSKIYNSLKEQLEHTNNSSYWLNKIQKNIERDCKVEAELRGMGWMVIRFWSKYILAHTEECVRAIEETVFSCSIQEL